MKLELQEVVSFPFHAPPACPLWEAVAAEDISFIWETRTPSKLTPGITHHPTLALTVIGLGFSALSFEHSSAFDNSDPFGVLAKALSAASNISLPYPTALGFVSYEAARTIEKLPAMKVSPDWPDVSVVIPKQVVIVDHLQHQVILVNHPGEPKKPFRIAVASELQLQFETLSSKHRIKEVRTCQQNIPLIEKFSSKEFSRIVSRAKNYIEAGDIFQVVLSNEFRFPGSYNPFSIYSYLRQENPSPYHFLFRSNSGVVVGASPETMLRSSSDLSSLTSFSSELENTKVAVRLVAGTKTLSQKVKDNLSKQGNLEIELEEEECCIFLADEKERAEHVMLVDHVRNDIGRVAKIGTVKVKELLSVERYSEVNHLVSTVEGELRDGETIVSALRSCFPIATLTGTPKIRAMEIISELELDSRGLFGGAIFVSNMQEFFDSCVAIRMAEVGRNQTIVRAGARIVYDSQPEREYEECKSKALSLKKAIYSSSNELKIEAVNS